MVGRYILYTLFLSIIEARDIDFANERPKIIWEDEKPQIPTNYFLTQTEKSIPTTTGAPKDKDLPLWNSKDSVLNLKFPKFLFTNGENAKSVWSISNKPKPKETVFLGQKLENILEKVEESKPVVKDEVKANVLVMKQSFPDMTKLHNSIFVDNSKPEEQIIKDKMLSLAKDGAKDLSNKIQVIEKTNIIFKNNPYYKIGYVVSYINSTYNAMIDLVKHVERNRNEWDVLKILNAFVQIKSSKEFLIEMLSVLNFLQSRDSMVQPHTHNIQKKREKSSIAWSYYDDL